MTDRSMERKVLVVWLPVDFTKLYDIDNDVYGMMQNMIIVKTKQAILIGVYDDKTQPGEAAKIVEQLADYLISVSY